MISDSGLCDGSAGPVIADNRKKWTCDVPYSAGSVHRKPCNMKQTGCDLALQKAHVRHKDYKSTLRVC